MSKKPVGVGTLIADHGLDGDVHAGTPGRQVSLLCEDSLNRMREKAPDVGPGALAENLTLGGLDHTDFHVGARIRIERGPRLQVTQIGKECHSGCEIAKQVGDCIMPREGIFARVIEGGEVRAGDWVEVVIHDN